ncbi:MAG TPA: phosphatase PAP2 family protein [bacterium]|nr:phosphatase PAP2 family protein [bacterium]
MLATLASFDADLLNSMRAWIDPDLAWLTASIRVLADLEVGFVVIFLVGLWLYGVAKSSSVYRREALLLFYGIVASFVLYVLLNLGLPMRARPETVLAVRPVIDHLPDNSFPSGHAIFASASALGAWIFLTLRRVYWTMIFFALGLLMCLARILAGVHYPLDIVAGYALGVTGPLVIAAISRQSYFDRLFVSPIIRLASVFRL